MATIKLDPILDHIDKPPRSWEEVQIEELQKEVAELKSQIRDLQDTIAQQNRRISSLECRQDGAVWIPSHGINNATDNNIGNEGGMIYGHTTQST